MTPQQYIRSYMAGVLLPSVVVFAVGVVVAWNFDRIPTHIEQAMVFPIALNPLLWGVWNVLYGVLGKVRLPLVGMDFCFAPYWS